MDLIIIMGIVQHYLLYDNKNNSRYYPQTAQFVREGKMLLEQQSVDLSAVFVDHRAQLRRAALKILGDVERAEDVVQDAYLKVTETEGVLNIKQPLAYLYQIVRNLAIDRHRCSSRDSSRGAGTCGRLDGSRRCRRFGGQRTGTNR